MEYSIAIPIFVFVLYGMIFLVQKFLEKVDPSIEEIDMSRVIPYLVISAVIIAIKYFIRENSNACLFARRGEGGK